MNELTAFAQFIGREQHHGSSSMTLLFAKSHTGLLKPILEQRLRFVLEGTLLNGLKLKLTPEPGNKRVGAALQPYNIGKQLKMQLTVRPESTGYPTTYVPASEKREVKIKWDMEKKEFRLSPLDFEGWKIRELRERAGPRKDRGTSRKGPQPSLPTAPVTPLERMRDSIRELNSIAAEQGIQLTIRDGRVSAILTFE